jgi:GTP-binding protein
MGGGRLRRQVGAVKFMGSFQEDLPALGLPEIAFAGRSNVGKSSALNRLLQRKAAARVSARPGRTGAINLFQLGDAVVFADLPGYGYAKVPDRVSDHWKVIIERYLAERTALAAVVVLVDARRAPQEKDGMLLYALTEAEIPAIVVATKVDKLKRNEKARQLALLRREFALGAGRPIPFSSVTGEGRDLTWDAIERAAKSHR